MEIPIPYLKKNSFFIEEAVAKIDNAIIKLKNIKISIYNCVEYDIEAETEERIDIRNNMKSFSIAGESKDGEFIEIEQCMIYRVLSGQKIFMKFCDIRISKGNILPDNEIEIFQNLNSPDFCGDYFDENGNRTIIQLKLLDEEISIKKLSNVLLKDDRAYFYCKNSLKNYNQKIEGIFENLFYLLSFIFANDIAINYTLLYKDKDNYMIKYFPKSTSSEGASIFHINFPNVISHCIDTMFTNYINYKEKWNIFVFIHYFVLIKNSEFIEQQYLLSSVLLESIKYNYAMNIKGYRYKKNYFYDNKNRRLDFRELILEVLAELNVKRYDVQLITKIKNYRNEIIHSGNLDTNNISIEDKVDITYKTIDIIEEVLLNILGFNGKYYWDKTKYTWINYPNQL